MLFILIGLVSIYFMQTNNAPRSFIINRTGFWFPNTFRVGFNETIGINFYIDGKTLEQKPNPSFKNGDIEVRLISNDKHPGSFYIREKGIDYTKCEYHKLNSYKVCSYTRIEDKGKMKSDINIIFEKNDSIKIASICTGAIGLTTVCTAWTPFMNKFKIAYSYQQSFQDNIIKIDERVKSLFERAETDFLNQNANLEN